MGTPYSGPFPYSNNGTISGIEVADTSFSGNVANNGTIATSGIAVSDSTIDGILYNQGTIDGGVTISGSSIAGDSDGYAIENLAGAINGGVTISGSTLTGRIYSDATINSGIAVSNSTITGGIVTSDSLTGGISIDNATVGGIGASGYFTGGISIDSKSLVTREFFALDVAASTFTGGITNAGTISVTGTTGVWIFHVTDFDGGITNSGTISVAGGAAVSFENDQTISGGLTNSGSIAGPYGVEVKEDQTFAGNIVNTSDGTITASRGILVSSVAQFGMNSPGGGIVNAGTIDATGSAIEVEGFSSNVSAFFGGITNSGTISDSGFDPFGAVNVSGVSSFVGDISNTGQIDVANGPAIYVRDVASFVGSIVNANTISAYGGGILVGGSQSSDGLSFFSAGITNSGAITAGVLITTTSGSYYSYAGQGIRVENVGDFQGGVVNATSGSISGVYTGIAISDPSGGGTFSGGVTNSGTISARIDGVKVEDYASFQGGIVNQSGASIAAGADGILASGISTFDGGITNGGTITGSGAGIVVAEVTTFIGDVSNSGTISVAAANPFSHATGISVADVGDFDGAIVNSGGITANVGIFVGSDVNFTGSNPNGSIVNSSQGTITAETTGILVANGTTNAAFGTNTPGGLAIVNAGTISVTGAVPSPSGTGILIGGPPGGSAPAQGIAVRGSVAFSYITGTGVTAQTSSRNAGISVFNGSITNKGTINAAGTGIFVGANPQSTGTVAISTFVGGITNSGTISGGNGILLNDIATFSGDIVNGKNGQITANSGDGIEIGQSAVGTNFTYTPGTTAFNGTYTTSQYGYTKPVATFLGSIINNGTISAPLGVGVKLSSVSQFTADDPRGDIVNTGTISGSIGIELVNTPNVSVFDSGLIEGTGGTAIEFDAGATSGNTLTLAAGYTITGDVLGGGTDTLQLGGTGAASFDLGDVGTKYTGFTTFDVTGGIWSTTGSGSDWSIDGGTFEVGGSATDTTVYGGGREVVGNGGTAAGTTISGGTMEVKSSGSAGSAVSFATSSGTLQIDADTPGSDLLPGTTISGFVSGHDRSCVDPKCRRQRCRHERFDGRADHRGGHSNLYAGLLR